MGLVTFKFLRKSHKRHFSFIPNLCTLANAFLGFLAIIKALDADYAGAALCIFCAAAMDMLDGRIARLWGMTSSLGMELDSLCDAVSFCCAPAFVVYCWCLHAQGLIGLAIVAFYLWCGLFRLARFNVTTATTGDYFIGLPTTCAAVCLASLFAHAPLIDLPSVGMSSSCWGMTLLVGLLALLMISTFRFPSGKRIPHGFMLKMSIGALLGVSVIAYVYAWPLKLLIPFGYIMSSIVADVYRRILRAYTHLHAHT